MSAAWVHSLVDAAVRPVSAVQLQSIADPAARSNTASARTPTANPPLTALAAAAKVIRVKALNMGPAAASISTVVQDPTFAEPIHVFQISATAMLRLATDLLRS